MLPIEWVLMLLKLHFHRLKSILTHNLRNGGVLSWEEDLSLHIDTLMFRGLLESRNGMTSISHELFFFFFSLSVPSQKCQEISCIKAGSVSWILSKQLGLRLDPSPSFTYLILAKLMNHSNSNSRFPETNNTYLLVLSLGAK